MKTLHYFVIVILFVTILYISSYSPAFALDTSKMCDANSIPHYPKWPSSHIYITDTNGNLPYIPLTYHTAILHDDDVWNQYPQPRTVQVTLTIQNPDGKLVFNQTQSLQMPACSGPESVKWRFVPVHVEQVAYYTATVSDDRGKVDMGFNSILDANKTLTVSSPLEQFKAGIEAKDVKCKEGLQFILKNENGHPTCVTVSTMVKLIERGWGIIPLAGLPIMSNTSDPNPQNNTGTINIENQTFYFTTLNDTLSSYHGVGAIPFAFHNIDFTLFPSIFSGGPFGSCGNTNFGSEVKFSDGTYEKLDVHIPGSPCVENYSQIVISNHKNPQAGLQVYQGKIRLLESSQRTIQTIPNQISNSTSFNGPEYKLGPDLLGPIPHQLVFFMSSNSTAKIFVEYVSHESNSGTIPSYSSVYVNNEGNYTPITSSNITITAEPSSIALTEGSDTIVVYNVTAKEGVRGVYWIGLSQFCRVIPLAIYVNSLTISPFEIPVQTGTMHCPAQFLDGKILGISEGTAEYKIGQPVG